MANKPARTELGRKLREIRQKIKASGQPFLDWDDIDREVKVGLVAPPAVEESTE